MSRNRRNRNAFVLSAIVFSLFVGACFSPVWGEAVPTIEARLLDDIKYLASDELEGRGVKTEGINKAADFIRAEFTKAGLDVTKLEGDAFQKFTMVTGSELGSPNTLRLTGPDGKTLELERDKGFRVCSFGGSGKFDADIVFCGYSIDAKDKKYQDLDGIDLKGKIAIIMRRVPQQGNPHGPFGGPHGSISRHGDLRSKVNNAVSKGAVAILFVNDPFTTRKNIEQDKTLIAKAAKRVDTAQQELKDIDASDAKKLKATREKLAKADNELNIIRQDAKKPDNDPLMKFGYGGRGKNQSVPIFHITQNACNQILKAGLKKTLTDLESEIDKELKPQSTRIAGWKASGETSVTRVRTEVKNVIGVLEGEGPLADETIIIGAHYDHVGMGGQGSLSPGSHEVHNGADDNASGSVALMELARRFGARKQKLPRRVVFIAFTAEELGLIGSARYVKEPLFPLEKTIAMFNMDMVGRLKNDKLIVLGIGTSPRWKELVETTGKEQDFSLTLKPDGFGPSDHSSFYGKKIPVLHLFTGTHKDYHRPTDDWDKINLHGMVRVVDMLEEIIIATANTKERPKYLEVKRKTTARRGGSRPYFGSIPDFGSEVPGYSIQGVAAGSPAAKGGLKGGDSIIRLGSSKVNSLNDFDLALRKLAPGDEVDVVVTRGGKEVKLKVILAKPR